MNLYRSGFNLILDWVFIGSIMPRMCKSQGNEISLSFYFIASLMFLIKLKLIKVLISMNALFKIIE